MTVAAKLERALDAIDAGTLEIALGALLEAWRGHRDERIAAAIDEVSARIARTRARPGGKRVAEKQRAWLELADRDDPADVELLLATLDDIRKAEPMLERIARLAKRPADPRIAAVLARFVEHPPIPGSTGISVVEAALRRIVELADPRQVAVLRRVAEAGDSYGGGMSRWYVGKYITMYLEDLEERVRPAASGEPLIDELEARLAATRSPSAAPADLESLFAAVYARPLEDEPRSVLADYLQQHGDPRGEFIALQLARARGGARSKREGELLRASGRTWLGAIEPLVLKSKLAFERGFVARCAIKNDALSVIDPLAERPEWATVTEVDVSGVSFHAKLLKSMPALRVLRGTRVAQMPHAHAVLEEVELERLEAGEVGLLASYDGLPALRHLRIGSCWAKIDEIEPLWRSPVGTHLALFEADLWEIASWIPRVLELPIAEIAISRRSHDPWGLRIIGSRARLEYLWTFSTPRADDFVRLQPLIASLPTGRIREVEVDSRGVPLPPAIGDALARFAAG